MKDEQPILVLEDARITDYNRDRRITFETDLISSEFAKELADKRLKFRVEIYVERD